MEFAKVGQYELRFFFFFQAEDGIRDSSVTGVQTCALPIFTVICGVRASRTTEIGRALRDCHATKPARKRNFLPMRGLRSAFGGRNCRLRRPLIPMQRLCDP